MSERLTVRIAERTRVSTDSGESCWLTESQENRLKVNLLVDALPLRHEFGSPTACTLATIGEGAQAHPVAAGAVDESSLHGGGPQLPIGHLVRGASRTLASVLDARYSAQVIGGLSLEELATVVVRSGRIRGWSERPNGVLTYRPVPSAGARHPCSLLVAACGLTGLDDGWWSFNAATCALEPATALPQVTGFLQQQQLLAALHRAPVAAIVVIADFRRTLLRYPAGTIHVWRDAGALLATLHLCATDIGLRSVITGGVDLLALARGSATTDVGALVLGR